MKRRETSQLIRLDEEIINGQSSVRLQGWINPLLSDLLKTVQYLTVACVSKELCEGGLPVRLGTCY